MKALQMSFRQFIDPSYLIWTIALLLIISPVSANETVLDSIHTAVRKFIISHQHPNDKVKIKIKLTDSRLRLSACKTGIKVSWGNSPRHIGNTTVKASCGGKAKWSIYVPAQIKLFKPVIVANTNLNRGERFIANHYQLAQRDVSMLSTGYISQPAKYRNFIYKRPIRAGQVISPSMLEAPRLIRRGQSVTLRATTGNLQVRSVGIALEDGTNGDIVRIRNSRSKRIIEGRIIAEGIVEINL